MQLWLATISGALRGARVGRTCPPVLRHHGLPRHPTLNLSRRSLSLWPFSRTPDMVPSPAVVAAIGPLEMAANNFPHDPAKHLALFTALAATKFKPSYKLITSRWERICEFDQQSPVLKSDPVFEAYLYALKEDGMTDSIAAAVRRREVLIGSTPAGEGGDISTSQAIADKVIAGNTNVGYRPPSFGEVTGLNPVLAATRGGPVGNDQGSLGNPVSVKLVESRGMLVFSMVRTLLTSFVGLMITWVIVTLIIEKSGLLKSGPANVKTYEPLSNPTRFSDVHGIDEVKDDLQDIVEFLKDPSMFATLGGKLPKGVMLTGPPGTGKTLLARAVAGEADVPFFFASGSDFEEMFVGVGAKRVRDLFAAARKVQPSIIFIDELDAVGGKRTARDSQYMKQTLNQLLVEMDGFQQTDGIIVMAATNTPESLDSALMRPGRFDKIIAVPLPDIKGRMQILQHHMKGITIDQQVDTKRLAQGTTSFSGADIQNMVNQAAIQAAKEGAKAVNLRHFEWAIDKILMGAEMKSSGITKDAKRLTAYHEAGHALVSLYTAGAIPLHKVTCNRRGHALGYTSFLAKDDMYSMNYTNYLAGIDVSMGGRIAEELVYGFDQSTSGCSSDLSSATASADRMVKQFGFSKDVGMVYYTEHDPPMSDMMKEKIDRAVQQILSDSVTRVRALIKRKEKELHTLAEALLEYETLDSEQVRRILAGEELPSLREVLEGDVPQDPLL